jgi:hypothetical protein
LHTDQRTSVYIRVVANFNTKKIGSYTENAVSVAEIESASHSEGGSIVRKSAEIDRRSVN